MLSAAVALLPVLLFLAALVVLDSFKLVAPRSVARTILAGCISAVLCLLLNGWLLDALPVSAAVFARYLAPPLEEALKALPVALLIRQKRVGFLVDAAIHGFAAGAGFALVENVDYLRALPDASVPLWVVRGFGTALLHGTATAIFAILAKGLQDRRPGAGGLAMLPGLLAAAALHSLFNHFLLPPLPATGVLLVVAPSLLVLVFAHSERGTREWLGVGFDSDLELLRLILSGEVRQTRIGAYLESLRASFEGTVLADMLCLLRIHLELSIRAKAYLLAQEAGIAVPLGSDVKANLEELRYLERSIGRTGLLALKPVQSRSSRDLWQLYMLRQAGG